MQYGGAVRNGTRMQNAIVAYVVVSNFDGERRGLLLNALLPLFARDCL